MRGSTSSYLVYDDGEVLATAFAPAAAVPVAVSQALVDATGAEVGGQLSATIGDSVVLLQVVAIVPTRPVGARDGSPCSPTSTPCRER